MKLVTQPPNSKLCGQCCVAMLAGITLDESIQIIGHQKGTRTKDLVKAFQKLNIKTAARLKVVKSQVDFFRLQSEHSAAILKCPHWYDSGWHWVVFYKGFFYDPSGYVIHQDSDSRPDFSSYLNVLM